MLLGLVFRGVAFEFRFKSKRRYVWNLSFAGGSIVAALMQGIMLGAILQGVKVSGRAYAGGWFDWLTPFSLFSGLSLLAGYALLGITWLFMKTDSELQARCFRLALIPSITLIVCIAIVSVWLPISDAAVAERWFTFPASAIFWIVPLLLAALSICFYVALQRRNDLWPYIISLGLFIVAASGFGITVYPYVVPRSITLWDAASPTSSLSFILVGVAVLIPLMLAYTSYTYWVCRGKVSPHESYH